MEIVNTAYRCYCKQKGTPPTMDAVEDACRIRREEAQLRLARIQNGAEPDYANGHPKDAEKGRMTNEQAERQFRAVEDASVNAALKKPTGKIS